MSDETICVPKMHPAEMRLARIREVASLANALGHHTGDVFAKIDPTYDIGLGHTKRITVVGVNIHKFKIQELEEIFAELDLALKRHDSITVNECLRKLLDPIPTP